MTRCRKGAGLDDFFSSWINRGENLPITPAQLQKVLGGGQIKDIAKQPGCRAGTPPMPFPGCSPGSWMT